MGWKTKALLAIGAGVGLAVAYYSFQLPAFFSNKEKKKTTSKKKTSKVNFYRTDNEFSGETSSGCLLDSFNSIEFKDGNASLIKDTEASKSDTDTSLTHTSDKDDDISESSGYLANSDLSIDKIKDKEIGEEKHVFKVVPKSKKFKKFRKTPKQCHYGTVAFKGMSCGYLADLEQSMDEVDNNVGKTYAFEDVPELEKHYKISRILGSGAFGEVMCGMHAVTEKPVAIKCLEKISNYCTLSVIRAEIKALQSLSHQHVCQLYEVLETSNWIYLVMEFCPEGSLSNYIKVNTRLSEEEARRLFRQILSAVGYIHSKGYTHRDLKPQNIMLDENKNIKLIDFGICVKPEGGLNTALNTFNGTPAYMAPEMINMQPFLGSDADVWSVGVILYQMLCGCLPFDEDFDREVLHEQIRSGHFHVPEFMSPESEQLLQQLLHVEPKQRIKIEELLHHIWVTKGYNGPVEFNSTSPMLDNVIQQRLYHSVVYFND